MPFMPPMRMQFIYWNRIQFWAQAFESALAFNFSKQARPQELPRPRRAVVAADVAHRVVPEDLPASAQSALQRAAQPDASSRSLCPILSYLPCCFYFFLLTSPVCVKRVLNIIICFHAYVKI